MLRDLPTYKVVFHTYQRDKKRETWQCKAEWGPPSGGNGVSCSKSRGVGSGTKKIFSDLQLVKVNM